MNTFVTIILLFSGLAHAQDYTPILDQNQSVGRLSVKENLAGDLIYVPALLSQKFFCNDENGVCTFQVFNQLSILEEQGIQQLRSQGRNTLSFRSDIYRDWLMIQSEDLTGEIARLQSSFMTMKNLAILENAYGTAVFKAPGGKTRTLTERYHEQGLGSMKVEYKLKGVVQDFSIRIPIGDLETLISQRIGPTRISFAELREIVKGQISLFSIKGYLSSDAAIVIAYQIKESFMKSTQTGEMRLDSRKWSQYKLQSKRFWTVNQSLRQATEHCTATLLVKLNGEMTQNCEVEYEIE